MWLIFLILYNIMLVHWEFAPIAQLDRALDYGSRGWGFESLWAYHLIVFEK